MAETYNPSDYTVDEVNAYLADNPDQVEAVLAAERDGDNRKGIVEGPHATPAEDDTNAPKTVTEAASEPQAGEKYEKGYEGFVPSRDGDNPVDLTLAAVTGQKDA